MKRVYGVERQKAKAFNFSIVYGKTDFGSFSNLSMSKSEAKKLKERWYESRPEVLDWQRSTLIYARKHGAVRTLMGFYYITAFYK